jgi:crotonobetainyl-CoA:carnitine CoA-transferase CaiB-like acyl-CoA transferase
MRPLADPRFATFADRQRHAGDPLPMLEEIFAGRTVAEWLGRLRAARVPRGPVNDVPQALADPQVATRRMIVTTGHPRYGEVRQVASAVRVGDNQGSILCGQGAARLRRGYRGPAPGRRRIRR